MPIQQTSWPELALLFIFGISVSLTNFLVSLNAWHARHEKLGLRA